MTIDTGSTALAQPSVRRPSRAGFRIALPFLILFALAVLLPFVANDYWTLIATRAAMSRMEVAAGPRSANRSAADSRTAATTSALPKGALARGESSLARAVVM